MSTHTTEDETLTEGDTFSEDEEDIVGPVQYDITSYGADYTVDSLVDRLGEKHIVIPPFQRGYVWDVVQASKFIESLILRLPVPGIFLFKEDTSKKLIVVDGQQRLKTLYYFFNEAIEGRDGKFKLRLGNGNRLNGETYNSLDGAYQRELKDSILHATISRQIHPSDPHNVYKDSMYEIFNRLNTGGTPLSRQEIRSCINRGEFNDLLSDLGEDSNWLSIYNPRNLRRDDRGKGEEIILRFFALVDSEEEYTGAMSRYLDHYMEKGRTFDNRKQDSLRKLFKRVIEIAAKHMGPNVFRPTRNFNVAVLDAFLVALNKRLEKGNISNFDKLKDSAESLLNDERFMSYTGSRTTNATAVRGRLGMAEKCLSDVE